MTISGATTPGQSGLGSDGNEGVLHIPQSSYVTRPSLSDCLSYIQDTNCGEAVPLCRGAIGVVYSPNQLGNRTHLNWYTWYVRLIASRGIDIVSTYKMVSIIAIQHYQFDSILIICLHRGNWIQILLFNTNYSIQHNSFVRKQYIVPNNATHL